MRKNILKTLIAILTVVILGVAVWYTVDELDSKEESFEERTETVFIPEEKTVDNTTKEKEELTDNSSSVTQVAEDELKEPDAEVVANDETTEDEEIIADTEKENEYTCTLSVRCDTILNNLSNLDENKHSLIPDDGVIFPHQEVVFYEGESVFNVLLREMKKNKIHFEFSNMPLYKSAYVEGIANIYQFDCGEQSGWMYSVNGVFPKKGCSDYTLNDGDCVEWVFTCDLGKDVGGNDVKQR